MRVRVKVRKMMRGRVTLAINMIARSPWVAPPPRQWVRGSGSCASEVRVRVTVRVRMMMKTRGRVTLAINVIARSPWVAPPSRVSFCERVSFCVSCVSAWCGDRPEGYSDSEGDGGGERYG